MNHEDEKLAAADKLEREILTKARRSNNDLDANLQNGLKTSRESTTLGDLAVQLHSIDDHLSYISDREQLDFRLIDIERSAKSTKGHARALHVYVLFIALVTAFWSAFVWWRNYDDVTAFFHALASRVLVFHPFS
jgi:hypothetical protein